MTMSVVACFVFILAMLLILAVLVNAIDLSVKAAESRMRGLDARVQAIEGSRGRERDATGPDDVRYHGPCVYCGKLISRAGESPRFSGRQGSGPIHSCCLKAAIDESRAAD